MFRRRRWRGEFGEKAKVVEVGKGYILRTYRRSGAETEIIDFFLVNLMGGGYTVLLDFAEFSRKKKKGRKEEAFHGSSEIHPASTCKHRGASFPRLSH